MPAINLSSLSSPGLSFHLVVLLERRRRVRFTKVHSRPITRMKAQIGSKYEETPYARALISWN